VQIEFASSVAAPGNRDRPFSGSFQVTFDLAPVTPVAGDGRRMDIMSAASDTGMDDQLQGIVDAIPELAWSAGPDGAADFFNQRRLPSLRYS
jgi:hypothetical protein